MIKVLIADDQELIRQSLQIVLNSRPDIMVTDVASNGQEVIRSVRKNKSRCHTDGHTDAQAGRCAVHENHQGKLSSDKNYYSHHV